MIVSPPDTVIRFSAIIEKVGVNPYVRVPARVTRYFGKRGNVAVVVHLEGGRVASTLVPVGGGVHRLYINRAMLRCTESRVGGRVSLGLDHDRTDRVLEIPESLNAAIRACPPTVARWASFTRSKRHEIIRYIRSSKAEGTRDRNIRKLMRILEEPTGAGVLCGIHIPERRQARANQP